MKECVNLFGLCAKNKRKEGKIRGQKKGGRKRTDREKEEEKEGRREKRSILFGQNSSLLRDTFLVKSQLHF